jgi:hypothetical protein
MAVPLPFKTPEMDVETVIAGVVVAVATVPAKPLADTTLALVTVPVPAESVPHAGTPDVTFNTWPADPMASLASVSVALEYKMSPVVKPVWPVPPLVVATETPVLTVPASVFALDIVYSVGGVSTGVSTTVGSL